LVEIELLRHTRLVEANIVQVETKIFELDVVPGATEGGGEKENRRRNEAKRSAWLNLSYLRNSLITWHVELGKIMTHSNALKSLDGKDSVNIDDTIPWALREVGEKIRLRLETIRREYDEKIRHCTMRLDGMAMATQWSHSETAAEQAMAANRETKVMKSISLVTMVFLPGTFFATVFSMTFFNWSGEEGTRRVSRYLWVYVVFTAVSTLITLGLWYFFVAYRRGNRDVGDEEKQKRR
jgi:Mg2+ and Co2+ transporter CorA